MWEETRGVLGNTHTIPNYSIYRTKINSLYYQITSEKLLLEQKVLKILKLSSLEPEWLYTITFNSCKYSRVIKHHLCKHTNTTAVQMETTRCSQQPLKSNYKLSCLMVERKKLFLKWLVLVMMCLYLLPDLMGRNIRCAHF